MNHDTTVIYKTLLDKYGPQGWWPVYSLRNVGGRDNRGYYIDNVQTHGCASLSSASKFEIAIGAILTQNTAWKNVEKALDDLINLGLMDPKIILETSQDELADAIRASGYYNQKAKKIKILTRFLLNGWFFGDSNIPDRADLLGLWGIGEETADSILLYAFDVPVFVIDAYTRRLFERIGIFRAGEKYEEAAGIFTAGMENDLEVYREYHALIVRHGKEHCRKKQICDGCVLIEICNFNVTFTENLLQI